MDLLVDIGNSATKFGVANNEEISLIFFVPTNKLVEELYRNKLPETIDNIYISSVVPEKTRELHKFISFRYKKEATIINPLDKSGVNIDIDNPAELGADLLCDLAAANFYYGHPVLVIDAGTATKILYIDENNSFYCCAITPGLELQQSVLNKGTALLPKINSKKVKPLLECKNTIDVINSSSYYAHIDMVNGLIARFEKEIGHPVKKVITGGNISLLKEHFNFEYNYDPLLCLKGIKVIGNNKEK